MSDTGSAALTLGKVLKALRTERDLSLEDIHQRTRISIKKLRWIEDDHFEDFEAPVFVRGYIRSYARVVGGDGDNLVALYDDLIVPLEEASPDSEAVVPTVRTRSGNNVAKAIVKFFSGLSTWAVIGVLIAAWLVTMLFTGADAPVTEQAKLPLQADSPPPPETQVDTSLEADASYSFVDDKATAAVVEQSEPASEELEQSNTIQADGVEAAKEVEFNFASDSEGPETPMQAASGQRLLEFQFNDDCWVEVRDASDSVIFADLKHKGDNLRLFGMPPLNIMLGNARAASLDVDGETMNIQVAGERKTLRFTVLADAES